MPAAPATLSPFVPPSGQPRAAAFVSLGTMPRSAPQTVAGTTGAPTAISCTQGLSAGITPPTSIEDSFNPLPLRVVSPINADVLEHFLQGYPCPGSRRFLLDGFRRGFDIGFRGTFDDPNARPRNLLSARNNVQQVTEAVLKELSRGHTSGPFPFPPFPHTHCSPIGAAPKPDGSVRLILDLSSP